MRHVSFLGEVLHMITSWWFQPISKVCRGEKKQMFETTIQITISINAPPGLGGIFFVTSRPVPGDHQALGSVQSLRERAGVLGMCKMMNTLQGTNISPSSQQR